MIRGNFANLWFFFPFFWCLSFNYRKGEATATKVLVRVRGASAKTLGFFLTVIFFGSFFLWTWFLLHRAQTENVSVLKVSIYFVAAFFQYHPSIHSNRGERFFFENGI